ncbi:MAG: hypothetical protein ACAH59_08555 [Pseudobdellovibrionaceae bacterium]
MLFLKIILSLSLFSATSWANAEAAPAEDSHAAPAGEGEGEKKEAGGGQAEAKAPALPGWLSIENKIQELYSKINSKKSNITKLLEDKNKLSNNTAELKNTVKEIVKEHKELRALAEDYQKNIAILRYRFPERNADKDRKYQRVEIKSIDEMEQAMSVDGKLNRNLKRMRSQYKMEEKEKTAALATEKPAHDKSRTPSSEPKGKSIEEAETIILQK